jgi:hypothetical protein
VRRLAARIAFAIAEACRWLHHASSQQAWRLVDSFLRSRRATLLSIAMPSCIAVVMVIYNGGVFGLVANAENLVTIGGLPYIAIRAARRYRRINVKRKLQRPTRRSDQRAPWA